MRMAISVMNLLLMIQLVNHKPNGKNDEKYPCNYQRAPQNVSFGFFAGTYQAQTFLLAGDADNNK